MKLFKKLIRHKAEKAAVRLLLAYEKARKKSSEIRKHCRGGHWPSADERCSPLPRCLKTPPLTTGLFFYLFKCSVNYSCKPLTVMTTIPAKYAAPKTPIPANITVRSFQISNGFISLCNYSIYLQKKKSTVFYKSEYFNLCKLHKFLILQFRFVNLQKSFAGFLQFAPFDIS